VKHLRPALFLLAVALFSASAWAQDPKPIPQKGTDATLITLDDPNPTVTANAAANSAANPCPFQSAFCVDDNFQNETGKTITSITMFFSSSGLGNQGLVFNCPSKGEMLFAVFFDNCAQSAVSRGEDITFSADGKLGFNGVASAGSTVCIPDLDDLFGLLGCDKDDVTTADGLFAIDMYGNGVGSQTTITTQAITAPEPGAGLLVLFSALAFALFKLVRRAV
jgi:hypothetical protein